jgi:DDE superfamily endonuclease
MLRYTTEKDKAYRILDLTSLSIDEFEQLLEPFEQAFVRHMQQWTMEGKPRTARAYTPYANSPLPTAGDRLLFILSYLKVAALQVAHGALFGMSQSNANKWIHVLLVVLQQTLRDLGDAPARHLQALEGRLTDLRASQADTPTLFFTTARNDQLPAPKIAMSKKRVIAARKSATP